MTFGGVAAFASASFRRLLLLESIVACTVAVGIVWFLDFAWVPGLEEAIRQLPAQGEITDGTLRWPSDGPQRLTEGSFLSIFVDAQGAADNGRIADVEFELGSASLKVHSLFGYVEVPYPHGWVMALNQSELEPWWGARKPFVLILVGVAMGAGLCLCWGLLAAAYAPWVRLFAFYLDRKITWLGCWQLAVVSLLPGAMFMAGAILLYGLHRLSFIGLLLSWPLHLMVSWVYLVGAPLRLPRLADTRSAAKNPFVAPTVETKTP